MISSLYHSFMIQIKHLTSSVVVSKDFKCIVLIKNSRSTVVVLYALASLPVGLMASFLSGCGSRGQRWQTVQVQPCVW